MGSETGVIRTSKNHRLSASVPNERSLRGLSEPALRQLQWAACLGDPLNLDLLARLSGTEEGIAELLKRHILRESAWGVAQFCQPGLRQRVLRSIPWPRRRANYRTIAGALEELDGDPEETAHFRLQGGETEKAVSLFLRAADAQNARHEFGEAARLSRKALESWPKGTDPEGRLAAMRMLARSLQRSGAVEGSVAVLQEMVNVSPGPEDPLVRANIYRSLAAAHGICQQWIAYRSARREAARAFVEAGKVREAALEHLDLASRFITDLELFPALDTLDKVFALAGKGQHADLEARALSMKGYVRSIQGKHPEGLSLARKAVSLALRDANREAVAEAYRNLAGCLEYASDFDRSMEAYEQALQFCADNALEAGVRSCLGCMSWVLFRLGHWKRCMEVCYEAIEKQKDRSEGHSTAHLMLGLVHTFRGESKTARKHFNLASRTATRQNHAAILLLLTWGMGAVHEMDREFEAAAMHYRKLLHLAKEKNDCHDTLAGLCGAALFFARQADGDGLNACVGRLASIANQTGNREALASLSLSLGIQHGERDEPHLAVTVLQKACKYFEELKLDLQLAYAKTSLGLALFRTDREKEAERLLDEAAGIAKNLGARPLLARIEASKRTLHPPAKTGEATHPVSGKLTRRQREVLRELASGASNKDIAQKLHLSPRTIDMHVSHILDRLNCRTRTEAVRQATRLDLIG